MAKTIKFNLICDGEPVRTLDDLREHFCVEDVLSYYKNGLLKRWLFVRGYEKELEAVDKVQTEDEIEIIKRLIMVFGVEEDEAKIEEAVYVLRYKEDATSRLAKLNDQKFNAESVINEYNNAYAGVVRNIVSNWNNMAAIKAAVKEINDRFRGAFESDYRELFNVCCSLAPMAVFVMLTYDYMRSKYIEQPDMDSWDNAITRVIRASDASADTASLSEQWDKLRNGKASAGASAVNSTMIDLSQVLAIPGCHFPDVGTSDLDSARQIFQKVNEPKADSRKIMYEKIKSMTTMQSLRDIFGHNLKEFSGKTDNYWKDLEPAGRKYMILWIGSGSNVRSAGCRDELLGITEIKDQFLILDGIDYRSNNASHKLLYMEV